MKSILCGHKRHLLLKNVKTVETPHIPGLQLKHCFDHIVKMAPQIKTYLPSIGQAALPADFVWTVFASIENEKAYNFT
jgi:hypothetical protein